jgi:lysophospholipase L1-like esterase
MPEEISYPAQLQKLLGDDYEVNNFGAGGTAVMKSSTSPYWETEEYKHAINSNPDIVLYMIGSNDAQWLNWNWSKNSDLDAFQRDYVELAK